jgi:hypothetical protein
MSTRRSSVSMKSLGIIAKDGLQQVRRRERAAAATRRTSASKA